MSTSPMKGVRVAAGIVCAVFARSCSSTCSGAVRVTWGPRGAVHRKQTDPAS